MESAEFMIKKKASKIFTGRSDISLLHPKMRLILYHLEPLPQVVTQPCNKYALVKPLSVGLWRLLA